MSCGSEFDRASQLGIGVTGPCWVGKPHCGGTTLQMPSVANRGCIIPGPSPQGGVGDVDLAVRPVPNRMALVLQGFHCLG